MKPGRLFLLLALFSVFVLSVAADDDDHVVVLTDKTIDDFLKKNDKVIVEFYAPWCGHCKRLEPEYKKAAAELKRARASTILAKVDATAEKESGQKYGVEGYPTIKYFNKGQASEFGGGRTSTEIVTWVLKRERPNVMELGSIDKLKKDVKQWAEDQGEFAVVAYLRKGKKTKAYKKLAFELIDEKESFGLVTVVDHMDERVEYYRPKFTNKHDPKMVEYHGKIEKEPLLKFLKESRYPLISDNWDMEMYAQAPPGFHTAGIVVKKEDRKELYEKLEPLLLELRGKVYFSFMDHKDAPDYMGVRGANEIMILERDADKISRDSPRENKPTKYRLEGPLELERVKKFFEDWQAKKLTKYLRSEDVSKSEKSKESVKVVVADNFDAIVKDPKKDVFVKYYAPWCGHCKKLEPDWEKLAAHVHKKYKNVVIAKIDATANDVEEDIGGFPSLVLYPAGPAAKKMRKRIKYESGKREFDALLEFVEETAESISGGSDEL